MTRRWGSAAAVGILLLAACSSTTAVPTDAEPLLTSALSSASPVGEVDVGSAGITVSYQVAGGLQVVPLPASGTPPVAAGIHRPSRPGSAFDAHVIVELARTLATTCKDATQSTVVRAVSASANAVTTTCGTSVSSALNGKTLPQLSGGWTLENLTTLWSELAVVVPDMRVTQILLYEDKVVFGYVSTMLDCPQIWWTRSFDGAATASCKSADTTPPVDASRFSPVRMLDAISTAGATLASASPQSVQVIALSNVLQVTLQRGSAQRVIQVAP